MGILDPAYTETEYADMVMKLLPKGQAWPRMHNTQLWYLMSSFGPELSRLDEFLFVLVRNAFPDVNNIDELIEQWEIDLGLPHCLPIFNNNTDRRIAIENMLVDVACLVVQYGASARFFYYLAELFSADLETGTAQTGGASTITLAAGASAVNDYYNLMLVVIIGGTGAGQDNIITAYNGTTKVATVKDDWTTQPDNTSVYKIILVSINIELDDTALCGLAECGLDKCGGLETLFAWSVTFKTVSLPHTQAMIECLINRFKPAHTTLSFSP